MKKIFSFLAVAALMGMMVACGGNDSKDSVSKDGVTTKNEIKEGDSDAVKIAKLTDQMVQVWKQEPSAEGYEAILKITEKMMKDVNVNNLSSDEVNKALAEINNIYTDEAAVRKEMAKYQKNWEKWRNAHEEEANALDRKYASRIM